MPNKEVEGAKPQIMQKDRDFQNHVTAAVKKAVHLTSTDSPSDKVNARVSLSLNLELTCGPDGVWAVSKADLKQPEQLRPSPSRKTPIPRPSELTESSDGDEEEDASILACSEIGESSDATWALQLQDGQCLFVPQMPPLPLSTNPFYALSSSELGVEFMEKIEQPEVRYIDNMTLTKSMDAPEPASDMFSGDVGEWGGQAEWVEPLAVEYPALEPPVVPEAQGSSWGEHKGEHEVLRGPHSEWVSEKTQKFGEVLGASYVGFEDRVLALLCAIEAELGISKPGVVSGKDKSHVPQEETKLTAVSQTLVRSLWRCRYVDWLSLDSVGASGGIILMWDRRIVQRIEEATGTYSISCRFREVASGFEWAFSGVYGPKRTVERSLMWEELASVTAWWEVPWCVGGDFNVARYPTERAGAADISPSMREFSDFIFSMGLIDLPMEGGSFTWSNARSRSRIDSYVLVQKLKSLKTDLYKWNKEVFGDVNVRKNDLMAQIQDLDMLEENRQLSNEEAVAKAHLQTDLEKVLLLEEIKWRQTSRATWLREGDKNTRFFHRVANSNRRFNSIDHLLVNEVLTTDQSEIGAGLVNFYKQLFSDDEVRRPLLDGLVFSSLDESDRDLLDQPFTEKEVWGVVRNMAGDKAPGPNGFSLAFFQSCWDVIKQDVMQVFHEFHTTRNFERSMNVTFLALIPKKPRAQESGVRFPECFYWGRQILDSVLVTNESLDSRLKSSLSGMLCKLDIEKAYDHVNWNFLIYMLRQCGFSERWRHWIYTCISSVRFSVLVNGSAHGFFPTSRGLRQGDPLSPLLFIIVMEALSRMLERAVAGGFISGFAVGNSTGAELSISHSLFADDTLIFCGADTEQAWHLRGVFIWFQAISGLKINLSKSELVPVVQVPNVPEMAGILGCQVASLPLKYLGLPLGASFKSKVLWDRVVEKMEKHLAGWKRLYLSKGGRVTLIKSTLSSIPTYFLSLFPIPMSVANRLEKLQRDFWWGGLEDDHKFHLVNWKQTCTPLPSGGLGIRNMVVFNKALLGKWLWRYSTEPTSLWRQVIDSKYGCQRSAWCTDRVSTTHGVSLWKHIRAGWKDFSHHISYKVGDGSQISFWHDTWCGALPLRQQFPTLFLLSRDPEAKVVDGSLFQVISPGASDTLCWNPSRRGIFEVRSYYYVLIQPHPEDNFPWKCVWRAKVPLRVAFFTWTAALGKILTTDNLRKRRVIILDWCCMCKSSGESTNHLLLHCPVAWELWSMVCILFGTLWVMPRSVVDLLSCWKGSLGNSEAGKVWKMIPHCIMWCLWRERNDRTFNGVEKSIPALKFYFLHTLLDWSKASHLDFSSSLSDLVDLCSARL
uniref:Reverse transcriptase domain-containing protein n=1 Tax=Fagus sylvatica TaxID=28930 RepID=A0A2N9GTW6_FAGSY